MYAMGIMITNVHNNIVGNTQMASLDRKVMQNGLWGYQCNGKVSTKMSSRLPSLLTVEGVNIVERLLSMTSP